MLTEWQGEQIVCAIRDTEVQRQRVELEHLRPFYLIKPRVFPDGNQWCALYGEDLQMGIAAFGDTPEQAAINFDIQWLNAKAGVRPEATA